MKQLLPKFLTYTLLGLLFACAPTPSLPPPMWESTAMTAPIEEGSGEGNLFVAGDGKLYCSWTMHLPDTSYALQYASFDGEQWSEPQTIASGKDWFVNWADFPAMAVRKDGSMAGHWLEKSSGGTYDYDVRVSQSSTGTTWNEPFTLHQDGVPAEHGFVSMQVLPDDQILAVWLDGRLTKEEGGAMTLRSTTFDASGKRSEELAIDERICDCCQTDVAITPSGAVAVYRDRTTTEMRDIYISRYQNGTWTEGKPVFSDEWTINGCPVNGPAVATFEQNVAVAWFAAPDNNSRVRVAFSVNEGENFTKEVLLDTGQVLGRVDIAWLNTEEVAVSWMGMDGEEAVVKLATVGKDGTIKGTQQVVRMNASRGSGFPILAQTPHGLYLAYRILAPTPLVKLLRLHR